MKNVLHTTTKLIKGTKNLFLLMIGISFLSLFIQSCLNEDGNIPSSSNESKQFLSSVELNKTKIGNLLLKKPNANKGQNPDGTIEIGVVVDENSIDVSELVSKATTIQDLSDIVSKANATLTYEGNGSNPNYYVNVSVEAMEQSLQPLVNDAKQYLYAKGFSQNDIQNMVEVENGKDEDLILLVMNLIEVEQKHTLANNYVIPFVNYAQAKLYWKDYARCAGVAIGADAIWALGTSTASSWTIAALTRAFSAVAKRFLGPIGVGIAVVSFGICLHEAYYD